VTVEACDDRRGDLAAAALGRLGPADLAALEQHLAGCDACRDELERLHGVAGVLALADPLGDDVAAPPDDLGSRVFERVANERRAARTRRRARALLAAAAVIIVVTVGVAVLRPSGDEPLDGIEVAFTEAPAGVDASATIARKGDGTVVELRAEGLDSDTVYALWLSSADGDRVPAGTFRPDESGEVEVRLPCALKASSAARIWATTPEGDVPLDAWFR
jgi:hypothetical protein